MIYDIYGPDGGYRRSVTCSEWLLDGQLSEGEEAVIRDQAVTSPEMTRRVAGATVNLPPRPSIHHVLNKSSWEWVEGRTSTQIQSATTATLLAQIAALELTQMRSVRELALARGNTVEARNRLTAIDDQIIALRAQLPPTP